MDCAQKREEATFEFLAKKAYVAPSWATHLNPLPSHIFSLGHFPTPIHKWNLPNLPKDTEVYLKRDDLSGMQLSGNKVRKLEFLLAEAVAQGADCVITIGGIQSNHCRATAVAAKYLNLDSYLILRTSKDLVDKDSGLTGNLLVERLVGAHVDLVSEEEYFRVGRVALTDMLKEKLLSEGRKPYVIPMGGSNSLGTWGYIEAIREIQQQLQKANNGLAFDDIVFSCELCSGKAVYGMMRDMAENSEKWEGRKVLFIHTGGFLGLLGKTEQIAPLIQNWRKMEIHETTSLEKKGIGKMF